MSENLNEKHRTCNNNPIPQQTTYGSGKISHLDIVLIHTMQTQGRQALYAGGKIGKLGVMRVNRGHGLFCRVTYFNVQCYDDMIIAK